MIVTPSFFDHWKTRLLVQITKDESTPLCLQRLWAYCQECRRHEFHKMTSTQLDSICHWGNRKPSCRAALVKSGFVEQMKPTGFRVHQWDEYNSKLLANWENGKSGGRPPKSENPHKTSESQKPNDNPTVTQPKPIDQTRPDQIDKKDQTDQTGRQAAIVSPATSDALPPVIRAGLDSLKASLVGGTDGRTDSDGIASNKRSLTFTVPTLAQVRQFLSLQFHGADQFAQPFLKAMQKSGWKSKKDGRQVQRWQDMARAYANAAAKNRLNQSP